MYSKTLSFFKIFFDFEVPVYGHLSKYLHSSLNDFVLYSTLKVSTLSHKEKKDEIVLVLF